MQRISVVGSSGAGKTTFARRLAAALDAPCTDLDAIHHLADWQPIDPEAFADAVRRATSGDRWVLDGNYTSVRPIIWDRADTVVFLDPPRWRVMSQLVPRSIRRIATGEELWNGNREHWRNLCTLDPHRNVVVWSFTRHQLQRDRWAAALSDEAWRSLRFVRHTSRRQADRWLDGVRPPPGARHLQDT